ncbi:hypothetical protein [Rhizobium oryzicola]|uniref:Periplasmic protein-like protein n=1 Tax=Rhizobium oryzicola TaxID=1232668 RepID=A0ABT8T963_9HYPH|nr:hypothetical protein [Rhizobium oryzicola]MDO1585637.1 hypothetical protein [Rhizobium oryzicola]
MSWLLLAAPATAAEISREPVQDGVDILRVNGTFNDGDDAIFRKLAASVNKAVVVLDSGGGNLLAGLEIGRAIRLSGFATAVSEGSLCASACALTWLAGTPRLMAAGSKLGFHAAYKLINGKASENGAANALVGAYLNQLGLSDRAVVYVTSAPPEGVEWLTAETAAAVGIAFVPVNKAPAVPERRQPLPHDLMSATTAFYAALASADGETAAALVVPEKRGKGPFNEQSIHAFYSAMTKSLKLTGTSLRGADTVRVTYEYTTDRGRVCNGRADVQTVFQYGRTLISRIKALDGC